MIDLDILVILDRSGSMQDRKADHEGGLRSFVEDQRSLAGDVRLTFVQFDTEDPCEIVYDRVALDTVKDITLVPRGGTPLLDACGRAIAHLRKAQATERAAQTLVMVVTDGEENASTEWTKDRVKALVDELEREGGTILYLGANVDAFADARTIGVGHIHALNVNSTPMGIAAAYTVTSNKLKNARNLQRGGASAMSVSASMGYTDDERDQVTSGTVHGTGDVHNAVNTSTTNKE
jgi:von Willebrand factor type A domain